MKAKQLASAPRFACLSKVDSAKQRPYRYLTCMLSTSEVQNVCLKLGLVTIAHNTENGMTFRHDHPLSQRIILTVSSLRLMSPGAVTDGIILFTPKGDDCLVIVLQTTVTTRALSAFEGDPLSNVLVNSSAKIFRLSVGCHLPWMVSPRAPPSSDATEFLLFALCTRHTYLLWLFMVGCVAQLAERRSLAGELTLSYARPAADG